MGIRKDENWNNRRKYSEQDVADYQESVRQQELTNEAFDEIYEERKKIIIKGLVSKYGFSDTGAKETMRIIEKGANFYTGIAYVSEAQFGSAEKKAAAERAYNYYYGIKS